MHHVQHTQFGCHIDANRYMVDGVNVTSELSVNDVTGKNQLLGGHFAWKDSSKYVN